MASSSAKGSPESGSPGSGSVRSEVTGNVGEDVSFIPSLVRGSNGTWHVEGKVALPLSDTKPFDDYLQGLAKAANALELWISSSEIGLQSAAYRLYRVQHWVSESHRLLDSLCKRVFSKIR